MEFVGSAGGFLRVFLRCLKMRFMGRWSRFFSFENLNSFEKFEKIVEKSNKIGSLKIEFLGISIRPTSTPLPQQFNNLPH